MFLQTVPANDPLLTLAQYGLLGLVLLMLLTGWLWAKPAVDDMKKQHELERKLWEERLLPSLRDLAEALRENNAVLKTNTNELSEMMRLLEERQR